MKPAVVVAPILILLLAGCSRPLTESECGAMGQKEIDYAMEGHSGADADTLRKDIEAIRKGRAARCLAGKTYDRRDYMCMMAAHSHSETSQCLFEANKHVRR